MSNPERVKSFRSDKYEATHPVLPEHEGLRLDAFVHLFMPTLSRQYIKKKIDAGEVEIHGRTPPHKPSVKVHQGERVTITTHNTGSMDDERWYGDPIPLTEPPQTMFEDDNLIVCNKPAFMITHPAGKHLFYCATVHYETIHNVTIHSIHRLDRETTGILMLGKNAQTAQKIGGMFEDELVRKCYFFIAHKRPNATPFPFIADENMGHDEAKIPRGMSYIYPKGSGMGKEAQTSFQLVQDLGDYVLGLAFPVTGRQHQIRLHAAHHGYPLLGDKMYNGDPGVFMRFKDGVATEEDHQKMQIPRHALHALAIRLPWPNKNQQSYFHAPLPTDLAKWLSDCYSANLTQLNNNLTEIAKQTLLSTN